MSEEVKNIYDELEKIVESIFFDSFSKPTPHHILQFGMWYGAEFCRQRVQMGLLIGIAKAIELINELEKHGYLERDKENASKYLVTEKYQNAFFTVYKNFAEKHRGNSFVNTSICVENCFDEVSIEPKKKTRQTKKK